MQIKCKYKKSFLCMQKLDPIRTSQEATETVARYTNLKGRPERRRVQLMDSQCKCIFLYNCCTNSKTHKNREQHLKDLTPN